ncbi:GAF domain-containing protein [Bacteroidales bacterium OttesenSCG-928-B11]|nr:GAF domain-containing protein [Bacteroidales bacterium OttesenSCG-928-B11]
MEIEITHIDLQDKELRYQEMLKTIKAVVEGETDRIANLANITAIIKSYFDFFWIGFYLVKDDELVLGPFQGTMACTRIKYGKGVCGTAWENKETILVANVDQFPGHIACSSQSKSEIVVPVMENDNVTMVLDIDSDQYNTFDEIDKKYLEQIFTSLL